VFYWSAVLPGIGFATAVAAIGAGAIVTIASRNQKNLDTAAANLGSLWQWVLEEESRYRERYPSEVESELWLVGISSYEDRDGHRLRWFETAKEVLKKQAACPD
jgi:NAD(P)-dependent dehydrogenase (short-subunit alcohol dehydrogenase family)